MWKEMLIKEDVTNMAEEAVVCCVCSGDVDGWSREGAEEFAAARHDIRSGRLNLEYFESSGMFLLPNDDGRVLRVNV
jgi:hypothetical protein